MQAVLARNLVTDADPPNVSVGSLRMSLGRA